MIIDAVKAEFKDGFILQITFENGETKWIDIRYLFDEYKGPIATRIKNEESFFKQGKLNEHRILEWPGGFIADPEWVWNAGQTAHQSSASYYDKIKEFDK